MIVASCRKASGEVVPGFNFLTVTAAVLFSMPSQTWLNSPSLNSLRRSRDDCGTSHLSFVYGVSSGLVVGGDGSGEPALVSLVQSVSALFLW